MRRAPHVRQTALEVRYQDRYWYPVYPWALARLDECGTARGPSGKWILFGLNSGCRAGGVVSVVRARIRL